MLLDTSYGASFYGEEPEISDKEEPEISDKEEPEISDELLEKVKKELLKVCSGYTKIKITDNNSMIISKKCRDAGIFTGNDKCCPTVKQFVEKFLDDTTQVFENNKIPHNKRNLELYFGQKPIIKDNFFKLLDEHGRLCMDDRTTLKFAKLIGYSLPEQKNTRYGFHGETIDVTGGSHYRRKRRTSKKSRKSRGRRRHRRSSHNKKRYTKRYRQRK